LPNYGTGALAPEAGSRKGECPNNFLVVSILIKCYRWSQPRRLMMG
jgi:hypothetical protein